MSRSSSSSLFQFLVAGILPMSLSPVAESVAIDFSGFDREVRPQDDFFEHVNGQWLRDTPIPEDQTRWGSFVILAEESRKAILSIIGEVAAMPDPDADGQRIRDLYRSYMDEEEIAQRGISPIEADLEAIDRIASREDFGREWARAGRSGIGRPFTFGINQDSGDATRYAVYFVQSGLGLPDRDFYFQEGDRFESIRDAYQVMLVRLFDLAGIDEGPARAVRVFRVERAIAEHHWTRVANRDRIRTYNRMSVDELRTLLPDFGWDDYLEGSGIADETHVIVRQPGFLQGMGPVIESVPLETWKDYFRARLLVGAAPYLDDPFFRAHFTFHSRVLGGQEQPEDRAERAVHLVNRHLGEIVGREYVRRHFPPEARERMLALVDNIRGAMAESLENLDWMSPGTRAEARAKLARFSTKIGYPSKWKDYGRLEIRPDDLLGNVRRSNRFVHDREVGKLGGPVDRTEWFMNPQTVNAYYNPQMNEIVFPAAILQPPFFNPEADDAVNYGAIGMVIGHEIGHGFDDQGRKSDGEGNLRDWWTKEDARAYEERTRRLVDQYSVYEPLEGQKVNGLLTLGENIGDLGGLTLAWRAWKRSLKGRTPPEIDGCSGEERFFLSFAQIWRLKTRPEMVMRRLRTDTHSPPRFRVIGPLSNFQPFYDVFGLQEEDRMWRPPQERIRIW